MKAPLLRRLSLLFAALLLIDDAEAAAAQTPSNEEIIEYVRSRCEGEHRRNDGAETWTTHAALKMEMTNEERAKTEEVRKRFPEYWENPGYLSVKRKGTNSQFPQVKWEYFIPLSSVGLTLSDNGHVYATCVDREKCIYYKREVTFHDGGESTTEVAWQRASFYCRHEDRVVNALQMYIDRNVTVMEYEDPFASPEQ